MTLFYLTAVNEISMRNMHSKHSENFIFPDFRLDFDPVTNEKVVISGVQEIASELKVGLAHIAENLLALANHSPCNMVFVKFQALHSFVDSEMEMTKS